MCVSDLIRVLNPRNMFKVTVYNFQRIYLQNFRIEF